MWIKCQSFPNGSLSMLISPAKQTSHGLKQLPRPWVAWSCLSKFANSPNLSGVVNKLEGRDAIQRHLDKGANRNLMKFNKCKVKCKVLHMGQGNPQYHYRLGDEWNERALQRRTWETQADEKWDELACSPERQYGATWKEVWTVMLPLCSVFIRPHLEYYMQLWGPLYKKDLYLLEQVRAGSWKQPEGWKRSCMKKGWESWACLAWRREGPGKTSLRPFNIGNGLIMKDLERFFNRVWSDRTRGSSVKESVYRKSVNLDWT